MWGDGKDNGNYYLLLWVTRLSHRLSPAAWNLGLGEQSGGIVFLVQSTGCPRHTLSAKHGFQTKRIRGQENEATVYGLA